MNPSNETKATAAAWRNMHLRCNNPHCNAYPSYGGIGVKVCERWNSFDNFVADIGLRPSPGLSLDRFPDPSGDYVPTNVRWATREQQNTNRRKRQAVLGVRKRVTPEENVEFATRLRQARIAMNLRIYEIPGVSSTTVSKYERGRSFPTKAKLATLCKALNVETAWLLNQ